MEIEPRHTLRLKGEKTNVFKCKAPLCLIAPDGKRAFSESNVYESMILLARPAVLTAAEDVNAALSRGERVLFENSSDGKKVLPEKFIVSAELMQNGEQPHYLVSFVKAEIGKTT